VHVANPNPLIETNERYVALMDRVVGKFNKLFNAKKNNFLLDVKHHLDQFEDVLNSLIQLVKSAWGSNTSAGLTNGDTFKIGSYLSTYYSFRQTAKAQV
jgi:hypothetical protein